MNRRYLTAVTPLPNHVLQVDFVSGSRLPDTKSTCKTWLGSGVTAVRYLRFKCVPSFLQK